MLYINRQISQIYSMLYVHIVYSMLYSSYGILIMGGDIFGKHIYRRPGKGYERVSKKTFFNLDQIEREEKEKYEKAAKESGMSLRAFIMKSMDEKIDRDML